MDLLSDDSESGDDLAFDFWFEKNLKIIEDIVVLFEDLLREEFYVLGLVGKTPEDINDRILVIGACLAEDFDRFFQVVDEKFEERFDEFRVGWRFSATEITHGPGKIFLDLIEMGI